MICIRSVTELHIKILSRSSSLGKMFLHNQKERATGSEGIVSVNGKLFSYPDYGGVGIRITEILDLPMLILLRNDFARSDISLMLY